MVQISFVLPYYKKYKEFQHTFRRNSIFKDPRVEVVIVLDENSEEQKVLDIVSKSEVKARVIVNDQEHEWRPPCSALNVGIRSSLGKYIAIMSPESVIVGGESFIWDFVDKYEKKFLCGSFQNISLSDFIVNSNVWDVRKKTVAYGFMLARKIDLHEVYGYDEGRKAWGGDDTDIRSRMREAGTIPELKEINVVHVYTSESGPCDTNSRPSWGELSKGSVTRDVLDCQKFDWGMEFSRVAFDYNHFSGKIIGGLVVKNYRERYKVFHQLKDITDGVIVLDNSDIGNEFPYINECLEYIRVIRKDNLFQCMGDRTTLMYRAWVNEGTHVVFLDDDMILNGSFSSKKDLILLANRMQNAEASFCMVKRHDMYNGDYQYRDDGKWGDKFFPLIYRNPFYLDRIMLKDPVLERLHSPPSEKNAKSFFDSSKAIFHYGTLTKEDRIKRYRFYSLQQDPLNEFQDDYTYIYAGDFGVGMSQNALIKRVSSSDNRKINLVIGDNS